MRRMYQEEWHRIPFRSFATLSSARLADGAFYSAFYAKFFEKYTAPSDLDPEWLEVKSQALDFVLAHPSVSKDQRILSLGCGLGLIERRMVELGFAHVEINEVSREPLRWVLGHFGEDQVHVGFFPECVPAGRLYDVVLMLGLDGVFDRTQLPVFLAAVRERLNDRGTCILVSWSHHVGRARVQAVIDWLKDVVKAILDRAGLRPRGQLWSFMRSERELRDAMAAAGFTALEDGLLDQRTRFPTYWITGRKA
jgi:hypothetical protein